MDADLDDLDDDEDDSAAQLGPTVGPQRLFDDSASPIPRPESAPSDDGVPAHPNPRVRGSAEAGPRRPHGGRTTTGSGGSSVSGAPSTAELASTTVSEYTLQRCMAAQRCTHVRAARVWAAGGQAGGDRALTPVAVAWRSRQSLSTTTATTCST